MTPSAKSERHTENNVLSSSLFQLTVVCCEIVPHRVSVGWHRRVSGQSQPLHSPCITVKEGVWKLDGLSVFPSSQIKKFKSVQRFLSFFFLSRSRRRIYFTALIFGLVTLLSVRLHVSAALLSPRRSPLNPSIPAPIDQCWMSRRSVRPRVQRTLNCRAEMGEIVVSSHPEPSSRTRPPVNHCLTVRDSPWLRGCSIEKNGVSIHIGLFKSEEVLGRERRFCSPGYLLLLVVWLPHGRAPAITGTKTAGCRSGGNCWKVHDRVTAW